MIKQLTIFHPNHGGGHHHMSVSSDPNSFISSSDPKERIREYHERVNDKRR